MKNEGLQWHNLKFEFQEETDAKYNVVDEYFGYYSAEYVEWLENKLLEARRRIDFLTK